MAHLPVDVSLRHPYETDQPDAMPGDYDAARKALKEAGYAGQKVVIINPTDFPPSTRLAWSRPTC